MLGQETVSQETTTQSEGEIWEHSC